MMLTRGNVLPKKSILFLVISRWAEVDVSFFYLYARSYVCVGLKPEDLKTSFHFLSNFSYSVTSMPLLVHFFPRTSSRCPHGF